jgi:type II secretory pathway component PulF
VSPVPELAGLLAIAILGSARFAVFEVETPWWRKALKWAVITAVTLALSAAVGHWAVLFLVVAGIAGIAVHFWWCRKHGIDPVHATPRRRYYELRGWAWRE